jgi:hypothetical protein
MHEMHISIRTTIGRQRNEMIIYYCMAEDGKESCSPASTRPVFSFQTDSCSLSKKKRIPAAGVVLFCYTTTQMCLGDDGDATPPAFVAVRPCFFIYPSVDFVV